MKDVAFRLELKQIFLLDLKNFFWQKRVVSYCRKASERKVLTNPITEFNDEDLLFFYLIYKEGEALLLLSFCVCCQSEFIKQSIKLILYDSPNTSFFLLFTQN